MTLLKQANTALRENRFEVAISHYVQALEATPALSNLVLPNLKLARQRLRKTRAATGRLSVLVCGWDLAHNAAGRVVTLAQIYQTLADVQIVGSLFPSMGREIWAPIRNLAIPIHLIRVEDERQFPLQAVEHVLHHHCDLLHISKPRFPNILIGFLYKLIWGSQVVVDIDDEELAFVSATEPLALEDYLQSHHHLPSLADLTGTDWTRIAVGLANAFDGVTVVNPALQQKYGGTLLRHARDEAHFKPSTERRHQSRVKFDITPEQKVVIFLGTPRDHKGLLETATAIAELKRDDVIFLIVGDFPPPLQMLKAQIESLSGLKTRLLGDQPFETIPDILAAGDICVLLQDPKSLVAQFQTPAKLSDALAMGLTVLAEPTPALVDLMEKGAFQPVSRGNLAERLSTALHNTNTAQTPISHSVFSEWLTLGANRSVLEGLLKDITRSTTHILDIRLKRLAELAEFAPLLPALIGNQVVTPGQIAPALNLPAVNIQGKSIGEVIQLAQDAIEQDDWSDAYGYLKNLVNRPAQEIGSNQLVSISQEFFKIDAFKEATVALERAAALGRNHPAVIHEQANQYYYHCYSTWLMATVGGIADWYKVDGLSQKPNWTTAVDLSCRSLDLLGKEIPYHILKRHNQASLLLAEEHFDNGEFSKFKNTLLGVLSRLLDYVSREYISEIVSCIERYRRSILSSDDATSIMTSIIKACQDQINTVEIWLCLRDVINWSGLLRAGNITRNMAIDQARGNANSKEAKSKDLMYGIEAAIDEGHFDLADKYLAIIRRKYGEGKEYNELYAFLSLSRGDIDKFREYWPRTLSPTDIAYSKYVDEKNVAIVSPAGAESEINYDIDNFDLVIRPNYEIGSKDRFDSLPSNKTNIALYNSHATRKLIANNNSFPDELDYYLIRRGRFDIKRSKFWFEKIRKIEEPAFVFIKSFNAIQAIVFDILLTKPSKVKLINTTFYTTTKHHNNHYSSSVDASNKYNQLRKLQPVLVNHDLVAQLKFIKRLIATEVIDGDSPTREVASLATDDYISLLESIHSNSKANFQSDLTFTKGSVANLKNLSSNLKIDNEFKALLGSHPLSSEVNRPLLIVGGGLSNKYFDNTRVPDNPVVFRVNLFMLENEYKFGRRVDAVFWCIYRRIIHAAIEACTKYSFYEIHNYFRIPNIIDPPIPDLKRQSLEYDRMFQPNQWHWEWFKQVPEFDEYFFNRKHGGLPTVGLQALAVGLLLGFKDIYISGIDFYRKMGDEPSSFSNRYAHDIPDFVLDLIADQHKVPGYESDKHSEDIDISFFSLLARMFPDSNIRVTSEMSPVKDLIPLAASIDNCLIVDKFKDIKLFNEKYTQILGEISGRIGGVSIAAGKVEGWAWDSGKNDGKPTLQINDEVGRLLLSFNPELYRHFLDMASIGNAKYGFSISLSNVRFSGVTRLHFKFENGMELSGSPLMLSQKEVGVNALINKKSENSKYNHNDLGSFEALFDEQYYLSSYPWIRNYQGNAINHYIHVGSKLGYFPNKSYRKYFTSKIGAEGKSSLSDFSTYANLQLGVEHNKLNRNMICDALPYPKRKGSGKKGIKSHSANKDHYWYTNQDSMDSIEALQECSNLSDKVKNILIIGHNWNLTTGVSRSISHYMNSMLGVENVSVESIELKEGASANDICGFVDRFDFIIINSIAILMNHDGFADFIQSVGFHRLAVYPHETDWGFKSFSDKETVRYEQFSMIACRVNYLCVSRMQANLLKSLFDAENCWVIYETTSIISSSKLVTPVRKVNNNSVVIMAGTVQPRKGVSLFSETADLDSSLGKRFEFRWAGRSVSSEDVYKSSNVDFMGELNGQNLHHEVSKSSIFFLSSIDDPFPLACMEAILLYRRVVLYNKCGLSEVVSNILGIEIYTDYSAESALVSLNKCADSGINVQAYGRLVDLFSVKCFSLRLNSSISEIIGGKA